jgi:hypothetical protein
MAAGAAVSMIRLGIHAGPAAGGQPGSTALTISRVHTLAVLADLCRSTEVGAGATVADVRLRIHTGPAAGGQTPGTG